MKKAFTWLLLVIISTALVLPLQADAQNCPTPSALTSSNITSSTAQLGWTVAMTTSYSNLQYRAAGAANWTTVQVQQLPYNLGNLTCATVYEWQVQAVCPNSGTSGTSPYSPVSVFTTLSCNTTCPAPTGLTATNVTATGAVLSWTSVAPAPGTQYNIQYQTNTSPNWISINNVSGNTYQLGGLTCNTIYVFRVQTICVNSATGATTLSPWSPLFTFITSACTNSCPTPTGLNATNVSATSAVLSWTSVAPAPGTLYNIQYQSAGSSSWTSINNVTSASYQLGGLSCNTIYMFQVQTVCVNSANNTITLSPWSQMFTFITAPCSNACPAPTGLTATNVSPNGVVLTWSTSAPAPNAFNLHYKTGNGTTWITINNITSPYQLGGLLCNTTYEWQVQAICVSSSGAATVSPWSASAFFTTAACNSTPCPAPTALTTSNITAYSVLATWTPVPGAPAYSVRYRPIGTLAWTYITSPTNSTVLSNLICGTSYQWQVRSLCGPASNTNVNQFSVPATFTTLSCNTNCLTPTGLVSSNITPNSAQLSWNTTGAPIYRVRYRMPSSGMLWIYQNTTATSLLINGLQPASPYEWQVQSLCTPNSNTSGSPWSVSASFQTLQSPSAGCPAPTGLVATSVSQQGGVLTWNAVAGAVAYNVRYKPVNSTLPYVTANTPTNFLQIGNLTAGVAYEWQVQSVCINNATGVTTLSSWSVVSIFTTPLLMTVYPNPADDMIKISLFADDVSTVNFELRDMFGKPVYSGSFVSVAGMNEVEIFTSAIHEGWYSLTINTSLRTTTSRVLINH